MKRQLTAALTALAMLGSLALCAIMPAMTCVAAQAEESTVREVTVGELTFTIENGEATLTKAEKTIETAEIPAKVEGVPVTGIGYQAFIYRASLISVTIPASVKSIGKEAF